MKINVLGIVKGVAGLAASAGAGVVVGNLVKATTPYDTSKLQKVLVGVGGYTIGAVLGDLSAKYINDQIDGYAEKISEIIHPVSEETVMDGVIGEGGELKPYGVVDTDDVREAASEVLETASEKVKPDTKKEKPAEETE